MKTEYVEPTLKAMAKRFGDTRETDWQVAYAILEESDEDLAYAETIWDSPTPAQEERISLRARQLAKLEAALHGYDHEERPLAWGGELIPG